MARLALSAVDKKDRATWRKHFALLFNQQAGGANSQAILAVWYAWITRESGKTIYGNNPLNLTCSKGDGCYPGQNGHYRFAGNSRNFASFATPMDGAKAVVSLLSLEKYRYPPILKAARADDYYGMVKAIIVSCWVSCAHPGYGGIDGGFLATWNSMRTLVQQDIANGSIGNMPGGATGTSTTVSLPFGTVIRAFDGITPDSLVSDKVLNAWVVFIIDSPSYVSRILTAAGFGGSVPTPEAWAALRAQLAEQTTQYKGKKVSTLPSNITVSLTSNATAPRDTTDPLEALGNAASTIATILGKLLDPQTYLRTGALILGLILAFTGFKMLMDATAGTAAPSA